MFDTIVSQIRAYIIRKLAEQVAADIANTGLTEADWSLVDSRDDPVTVAKAMECSGDPREIARFMDAMIDEIRNWQPRLRVRVRIHNQ